MAKIITAIDNGDLSLETELSNKLFLAGGTTNCPNWQKEIINYIKDYKNLIVYNPRREDFSMNQKNIKEQIAWEYKHLRDSNIIIFWFSRGSLNPIALYELGRWGNSSNKDIIVGIDKFYDRKIDVTIQTKLSRPDVLIVDSLNKIADWIYNIIYKRSIKNK